MIKLIKFLNNPIKAYEAYQTEYNQKYSQLYSKIKKLENDLERANKRVAGLRRDNQLCNNRLKDECKAIRTLHYFYEGYKLKKGLEYEYVEQVKEMLSEHK